MSNWKGIIGNSYTPFNFVKYVQSLKFGAWRPQFVVLHNTGVPTFHHWHDVPGAKRMKGLEGYYKHMGWAAGPHLFIADDYIWVFTPLTTPGVHSPSWNAISWGVEMVGDYDSEPFFAKVRANTINALATLHLAAGLDSSTLRFHREDPKTTHKSCPGSRVKKDDIIAALHIEIASRIGGEHSADRPG